MRVPLVIGLVLIAGGAGYLLSDRLKAPNAVATTTEIESNPLVTPPAAPAVIEAVAEKFEHTPAVVPLPVPVPVPQNLPPLPPSDRPFAEQFDALVALAEAGEPVASCRLALDSLYCQEHELSQSFNKQMSGAAGSLAKTMGNELAATLVMGAEDSVSSGAGFCAGFSSKSVPDVNALLNRALPRLSVRQKLLLALARPDGSVVQIMREPPRNPTIGGGSLRIYSQFLADHAMDFLHEGIVAADPMALEAMILVHAPGRVPDAGSVVFPWLPDPYKFAGYALLQQQLSGSASLGPFVGATLEKVRAELSIDQWQTLQRAVNAEEKRWQAFQDRGRSARPDPTTSRASNLCAGT